MEYGLTANYVQSSGLKQLYSIYALAVILTSL
jgi:hypothetical protein